jgi:Fur family ferric uptake transcriptional regulator
MKDENAYKTAVEVFTKYMVANKYRKTPERYAIFEKINEYEGHFSAEELYCAMQQNYRVSLATVYNTLELLCKSLLIVKHQFGTHEAQYEKIFGNSIHHHLICTGCGRVREFSDKNIRIAIQSKRYANFAPQHYSLYVYGLCNDCKKADTKKA